MQPSLLFLPYSTLPHIPQFTPTQDANNLSQGNLNLHHCSKLYPLNPSINLKYRSGIGLQLDKNLVCVVFSPLLSPFHTSPCLRLAAPSPSDEDVLSSTLCGNWLWSSQPYLLSSIM